MYNQKILTEARGLNEQLDATYNREERLLLKVTWNYKFLSFRRCFQIELNI